MKLMQPFSSIIDSAVPLPMQNVDTDQIIPARFLKAIDKAGFGDNLFRDWRYDRQGAKNEQFVLNNPKYKGSILVAGTNFGCGSSREHAAWALYQYGFRCVVSSFFADIFKNNALNNGIVTVEVSEDYLHRIFLAIENNPNAQFEVDLKNQEFTNLTSEERTTFELDPYKKQCLLEGKDDIDYLISLDSEITSFESSQLIY
jgi:3-isopropylmalate/(R)-2-methylmalate dehydratase small subunit